MFYAERVKPLLSVTQTGAAFVESWGLLPFLMWNLTARSVYSYCERIIHAPTLRLNNGYKSPCNAAVHRSTCQCLPTIPESSCNPDGPVNPENEPVSPASGAESALTVTPICSGLIFSSYCCLNISLPQLCTCFPAWMEILVNLLPSSQIICLPEQFPMDQSHVGFIIGLMTEAILLPIQNSPDLDNYTNFVTPLRANFNAISDHQPQNLSPLTG